MRRVLYVTFLLSVLVLFQNCSPNQFKSESASVVTSETPAPTAAAPRAPASTTPTCVAPGQKLFADRAFIYYRVCENERADWQIIANRYCCSGEALIIDVETVSDYQCAQGRIAGVAYCE